MLKVEVRTKQAVKKAIERPRLVFFPPSFAENGALYLVLGREQSTELESGPTELEKAEEIIAGIRDP